VSVFERILLRQGYEAQVFVDFVVLFSFLAFFVENSAIFDDNEGIYYST
jgi:hypothetical protein